MLHINSELTINGAVEPFADVPAAVEQHVSALDTYALELAQKGEFSPEAATFAQLFAKRHDAGYGVDIDLLQTDFAADVLGKAFEAVEAQVDPQYVIDYLKRRAGDYMVARIIGHGVLGLVANTQYFKAVHQLSSQKALGLASILSAHHSGFPITMVSSFEGVEIPPEARSAFFIDDGGENPEVIRHRLAALGASELGISTADALRAAVLGYSIDRLTAGRIPEDLQYKDGRIVLRGGEVAQKKYPLVAGDLNREGESTHIAGLFNVVLHRLKAETDAAIIAADEANAPDLRQFVETQQATIHTATHNMQERALRKLWGLGLVGRFSDLHKEREKLHTFTYIFDDPALKYALVTYDAVLAILPET